MHCLYFVQARKKHPLPKMGGKLVKQICPLMRGGFVFIAVVLVFC